MVAGQRKGFTVNAEHVSYSVLADIFFLEKKIYIFFGVLLTAGQSFPVLRLLKMTK